MSENQAETPEPPAQAAQETPPTTPTTSAKSTETDWQVEARKWEKRAKENFAQVNELKPRAEQFSALEEASKSELQRIRESLEVANRERETARSDARRFRVAAEHGIDKDDLDLLGTGDEEQLTARAVRIADLRKAAAAAETTAQRPPQRPNEQLRPGATPSGQLNEDDALYEQIYGSTSTK